MIETSEFAFNKGCDARLSGVSRFMNPYLDDELMNAWDRGWLDVEKYWGQRARGEVRPLPEVK